MNVTSVFAAFGLSGAAGLNAWLPLFVGALLERVAAVDLAAPFDELSSTTGLVILGLLTVADFVGDKIPAVRSAARDPARHSPVRGVGRSLAAGPPWDGRPGVESPRSREEDPWTPIA